VKISAIHHEPQSAEQRIAAEYAKMPPNTEVPVFFNGTWSTMTAREVVLHHLKLHDRNHV